MARKVNRRDDESGELNRKKRIKSAFFIAVFVVGQIIIGLVFSLVVLRTKSPKLRLNSDDFSFRSLETTTSPASFDMSFATKVAVKNPNWGPYKFQNSTVAFSYEGVALGRIAIPKGKAGIKSTKKIDEAVQLSSSQLGNTGKLAGEINGGILTIASAAKLTGKVELMMIMKKKKLADMNCTIVVDVKAKTLRSFHCM